MSYELELVWAPADGQWFIELPILFVFARFPPEDESVDEDWVMGARGWTRDEAVVAINGVPTDQEWCTGCLSQHGRVLEWRASDREGDLTDWEVGENTLTVAATFVDGTVIEESRTFHYDPTLEAFTGWMVELDEASQTITFAASTYGSAEEDGAETGPVTSVIEYPVRDDAAFILLGVDSSGQPPPSTLDFEEFTDLIARATAGECDDCFYGSWNDFLAEPDSEHGAEYFVIYLRDGEIQQLEQIWRP